MTRTHALAVVASSVMISALGLSAMRAEQTGSSADAVVVYKSPT